MDNLRPILLNPFAVGFLPNLDPMERLHTKIFIEMGNDADLSFKSFCRKTRTGKAKTRDAATTAAVKINDALTSMAVACREKEKAFDEVQKATEANANELLDRIVDSYRLIIDATRDNMRVRNGQDFLITAAKTLEVCQRGINLHVGKPTERIAGMGVPSLREIIEARRETFTQGDIMIVKESIKRELTTANPE